MTLTAVYELSEGGALVRIQGTEQPSIKEKARDCAKSGEPIGVEIGDYFAHLTPTRDRMTGEISGVRVTVE